MLISSLVKRYSFISLICLFSISADSQVEMKLQSHSSSAIEDSEQPSAYSNYFSFHGEDAKGKVYFAIDNNRVSKKKSVKANNFLYFNIDGNWKKLKGHYNFKSEETDISRCFDSEDFKFVYKDNHLISIVSITNKLRIDFEKPLEHTGAYGEAGVSFDMFATRATLSYQGRTFDGNIISEQLIDPGGLKTFSNILKVLFQGFKYDGYYLNAVGLGDLYVHLVTPEESINVFTDNIYNLNTSAGAKDFTLEQANYTVTKYKRVGFRKLPLELEIDLGESKLLLTTSHFQKYRNLLFFAFGMGTVHGELIHQGKKYEVYGLSELFEF